MIRKVQLAIGILFACVGLIAFGAGQPLTAIIYLLIAVILIPQVLEWAENQFALKIPMIGVMGLAAILFIVSRMTLELETRTDSEIDLSDSEVSSPEPKNKPPVVLEEKPPLNSCKSTLGKFVMSDDGFSQGKKTELTELLKKVLDRNCDIIDITFVWITPPYPDIPMRIVYDRLEGSLQQIYTERNVIEQYYGITEDCLIAFLKKGEKDFGRLGEYCKDMQYDFNNREMKHIAVGAEPHQSDFDGSVSIVMEYVASQTTEKIEFLEWSKVTPLGKDWVVRCKYRLIGSGETQNWWFYIQNGVVVDTKRIE